MTRLFPSSRSRPTSPGNMTRAELIDQMASLGPLSHKQADVVVETILDSMKAAIAQGDRIEIRGFGVFSLRLRRPRRARNPRTGEPLVSSERRAAHFKPGKELKAILAGLDPGARPGGADEDGED